MLVISCSASNGIGEGIAKKLSVRNIMVEHKVFPDGETYVRIPVENAKVEGEDIVVVQSTYNPQDKHLIELFLTLDLLKDLNANRIIAVVPYLAYARQDKRFRSGEPISIKTILKLLEASGADSLITVDIHKEESLKVTNISSFNLTAVSEIAKYISKLNIERPMVLAPDKGALWRAKMMAEILNTEYDYIEKKRDRITGEVTTSPKSLDVKGKSAVIIDDVISTGGTVALAARMAKSSGALKVIAACTHPVLVGNALDRLKDSGVDLVIATNTIPSLVSKVDVAGIISEKIKSIL